MRNLYRCAEIGKQVVGREKGIFRSYGENGLSKKSDLLNFFI